MSNLNGNYVPSAVIDKVLADGIKNKILHVENDRYAFDTYFVDKDQKVQRVGSYLDNDMQVRKVTHAELQTVVSAGSGGAVDINLPSEAHIKEYITSLTITEASVQNAVDKTIIDANLGLIEYQKTALDPIIARYMNVKGEIYTIYQNASLFPKTVVDVAELMTVKAPIDGTTVQVLATLPVVSMYTFNSTATVGVKANDGTMGKWNRLNESGYHAKNSLTANDVITSSGDHVDGPVANLIDGDLETAWKSADGEIAPWFNVVPATAFIPSGYSFERASWSGDNDDLQDAKGEGEPTKWKLEGELDDGTLVVLDTREEMVLKDGGPTFYPLSGIENEYVAFKFSFELANGTNVVLSELKITEVVTDQAVGYTSVLASDL